MSIHPNDPLNLGGEDALYGSGEDINLVDGHIKHQSAIPSSSGLQKRSRKATGDAIVDAMLEIAAASKMRASIIAARNEDEFSISKCIQVFDDMQDVHYIYYRALDLFELPSARETFISLKSDKRLIWLQRKCGVSSNSAV